MTQRKKIDQAVRHLRTADPVMRCLIDRAGECTWRPQRDRFGMLVRSIISQQISTAAARSIQARLEARLAPGPITAAAVAALPDPELRALGLSRQKATYLHDLAEKVATGVVQLDRVGRWSDERVIAELTQVNGIGHWTAQMFLIFSLGRLDVFPHGDLGVRSAIRDLYGLAELPGKSQSYEIAEPWRPFATVASWYCWRSLDLKRAAESGW